MSKKDSMLAHITNNVKWLMTTENVEIIPYYNLSYTDFNRAKQYFAGSAEYDDVVCLLSTSVLDTGKSGVLFTTENVYSKAWGGILTSSYKNGIYSSAIAEFDFINEFDTERMKELMSDLADIAVREEFETKEQEQDEKQEKLKNIGRAIGKVTLSGMILAEIVTLVSDYIVDANNDVIQNEVGQLDSDSLSAIGLKIYQKISEPSSKFIEILNSCSEDEDIDEDIFVSMIASVKNILIAFYNQTLENIDVGLEDMKKYTDYANWVTFWALLFHDADAFIETYPSEILHDIPDVWKAIIDVVDNVLEDGNCDYSFSDITNEFSEGVISNQAELAGVMENSSEDDFIDDGLYDKIQEIIESNNNLTHKLLDGLDRASDYLISLFEDGE